MLSTRFLRFCNFEKKRRGGMVRDGGAKVLRFPGLRLGAKIRDTCHWLGPKTEMRGRCEILGYSGRVGR